MANRNNSATNDFDLSLTGSQILSARSNKRPSSSSGRTTTNQHANGYSSGSEGRRRVGSTGNRGNVTPKSSRSVSSSIHSVPSIARGISDEFLALFDNGGARPKVNNRTPPMKKPLMDSQAHMSKTSHFPGSARSNSSTPRSKRTNSTTHTSHSIFRPDSPMSSSTLDDGDSTARSTSRRTPMNNANMKRSPVNGGTTPRSGASSVRTPRSNANSVADRLSASANSNGVLEQGLMNNEINPTDIPKSPGFLLDNGDLIHNRMTSTPPNNQSAREDNSRQTRASTSNHKDLNATNNMLPQSAESRHPVKLELRTMPNSLQNATWNVNKTPVNEIHHTSSSSISKKNAEDYIKKVNMAASKIQCAFRRYIRRRKALRASEAAMRRLLTQKKDEFTQKQTHVDEVDQLMIRNEQDRQKKREERARQVRKQAIEELNRRKEEEKQKSRVVAEAEVKALKKEGKVGRSRQANKGTRPASGKSTPRKNSRSSNENKRMQSPRQHQPESTDAQEETTQEETSGNSGVISGLSSLSAEAEQQADVAEPPATPSQIGTTLDDLMSTLKLLEEEESLPVPPERPAAAWQEDGFYNEELIAENLEEHSTKQTTPRTVMANSKLQNILSFLDEVETGDRLEEINSSYDGSYLAALPVLQDPPSLSVPSAEQQAQMEEASAAASEVTNTVLKQRLQLDEKSRSVQMLQKALNQQRELTIRHAKETEKEMKKRLDVQKTEYEETVQRHLGFIDQLIDDKKSLSDKCEQLVTEMKTIERKYSTKVQHMQDSHDRELNKVKEVMAASEKLKRERWIEEKTKKIKEVTVKGLEPEIQRLISKHKGELKKLKSIHEAELLQSDERAGQRYVSMTEELRDQLAKEKEAACQRERELAAQRYEKQLQAEEEAYQQSRRRLYQEIQEEKERLAQQASRQRQEIDKLQRNLEDSHGNAVEVMKKEYEKAREEQERRHESEIRELQERLSAEKEAWEQNYMKKQEAWLLSRERELKDDVRKDRDREIELVIARLDEDSVQAREECERAAENRIKRIREKYEAEMEELEKSERHAMEKHNTMKAELIEFQGANERYKVILKQKDQEIDDIKRLSEKLHKERDHVQDVVRQEFADKLVATDEENKRVKQDMAELKSRHKVEIERMKQDIENVNRAKQEEMDAVHARVKQAIAKKEEVVSQVKQQCQAAVKRADHLESLLDQQRKQLLGKK